MRNEVGAHPQDIINRQLLGRCDFLIAIFASSIGSATATDASGTLQEIREFAESDKGAGGQNVILTCFMFFGQVFLLFWMAQGELSDVKSQIAQAR